MSGVTDDMIAAARPNDAEATVDRMSDNSAAAPHPAADSIATAKEWVASGAVSAPAAGQWLYANRPDAFADLEAAQLAMRD
jgi:hypothetical protein